MIRRWVAMTPTIRTRASIPANSSVVDMSELGASLIAQAEKNKALMASFGKELELLETRRGAEGQPRPPMANGRAEFILEFRDVTKEFPVTAGAILRRKIGALHAVTDVQLGIRPGETFGLVGESGCGKTTLGRMGVGLEIPTSGQVLFDGTDLGSVKGGQFRELRRDLQFMFQDPYASLDPRMRVKEIISEPLDIARRGSPKERIETVRSAPRRGRAWPTTRWTATRTSSPAASVSASAWPERSTLNPKVIIADEPVSALDVSIRSQILNLMKRLQATHGLTYIVISHDLSVVKYLADRIGVMYLGKLVEIGPGNDIYDNPAHPYTAGLLEAIPVPESRGGKGEGATRSPSVESSRHRCTRRRAAASAPAARGRRTSAPRWCRCCARSARTISPRAISRSRRRMNGDGAVQQLQATPRRHRSRRWVPPDPPSGSPPGRHPPPAGRAARRPASSSSSSSST